jgi:oligoendopeptidase F
MSTATQIPERSEIADKDKWDLSKLCRDNDEWERLFEEFSAKIEEIEQFQGTLGESPTRLRECLELLNEIGMYEERLGYYAHLRMSENAGDSAHQERFARFMQVATKAETLSSFVTPEIQAIPDETMERFLQSEELADFRVHLNKLLRYKPHVLSEREERLLAMQEEFNQTPQKSFGALTDVDMDFGTVQTPEGEKALSQSTYGSLMQHTDRGVRERAFKQFHGEFEKHKNTITNLYAGSVNLDIYKTRARNFPSARAAALFPDDVPESVYDTLIETVRSNFDTLHRYYDLRRRALGVGKLHLFDTRVPLVGDVTIHHTYEEAVEKVVTALEPLGSEYTETLRQGLLGGWVDRYENKGKRSGAFSAGSYVGDPYILMNFKEDLLRDVFTLAHEGGHSMHTWYSVRHNPFQHYHYTIFEAEVASTFNEQLLYKHLLEQTEGDNRAYLVNSHIDDIVGTLFRQTMFAEFEKITHEMVEGGRPLTVDSMRREYRKLLEAYFGDAVEIDEVADVEGMRIPHFYRAFYVYKYATGISAAISLADRVLNGGAKEREEYFQFLKSGGSRFPIQSLQVAGVDMTKSEPIQRAIDLFAERLDELEAYLGV